jgi:hypothetical protein
MSQLQLDAINHILEVLEHLEIPYWLFGGWAVDFYAGRVTREHSDIDIAIWLSDLDRTRRAFEEDRWEVAGISKEEGLLQLRKLTLCLDVTYVERDAATGRRRPRRALWCTRTRCGSRIAGERQVGGPV